ncbi:hypothetical protein SAMN05518871_106138 [Psychrobacillus sp. OK028]|uniref:hypothetical protein n=1 Tax=Psychrobacillus sp. OK028 TaxID=1884359 RepID=UPI00088FEEF4|nr:hypothetical protein [Psychrobacillus sp. OK028]SDN61074.1 hypothetical protein SAMN05518871_106138 [Psychrobacillus sp. OK028]
MTNQGNNQNQRNNSSVAKSIKNTAGSAFETAHNALEATENIAMNTVDATENATKKLTGKNKNNR